MKQSRNEMCECGSGKKYKNCCMIETENSFIKKNGVKIIVATFLFFFGYFLFDKVMNSEESVYCYECRGYFPVSQAASHQTEPPSE